MLNTVHINSYNLAAKDRFVEPIDEALNAWGRW